MTISILVALRSQSAAVVEPGNDITQLPGSSRRHVIGRVQADRVQRRGPAKSGRVPAR